EKASHRRKPINGRLDTPERTLLAWLPIALGGFMLVGVMRHTTQTGQWLSYLPGGQMPYKAFLFLIEGDHE
ncbi:MAG: hypothetical protein LBP74_04510, partial [Treponema sp.]|nr:hypothetical protein [Treponema sp.]